MIVIYAFAAIGVLAVAGSLALGLWALAVSFRMHRAVTQRNRGWQAFRRQEVH